MTSKALPRQLSPAKRKLRAEEFERAAKVMVGQLAELMTDPRGHFRRPAPPGHQRGIDYYPAKDLVMVVAASAAIYRNLNGEYPQLINPEKLTEKIFWAKLFRPMKVPESGNKLSLANLIPHEARSMVEIPEVVWRSTEARLPPSSDIEPGTYYLKTNHGSDMFRRIEWPLSDTDRHALEQEFEAYLTNSFGYMNGEWWYLRIRREIFLERSVTSDPDSIAWYCYTFGERVPRIVAYRKTAQGPQSFWLNPDFTPVENQSARKARTQFDLPSVAVQKRMVEAARVIGRHYSFVRVDFLLGDDEQLYLSELTFTPNNGRMKWSKEMDLEFGAMWNHELNPRG